MSECPEPPPIISAPAVTEQELRAFVGANPDYYVKKWTPALQGSGKGTGFNWAGFFLAGLWLPYRKMYVSAVVLYGIVAVFSLPEIMQTSAGAESHFSSGIGIILAIVCGARGNRWYFSHAKKVITQIRARGEDGDAHLQIVSKRGGTNLFAALGFLAGFLVTLFGIGFVIELISAPDSSFGKRLSFDAGELYYTSGIAEEEARKLGEYLVRDDFFDGKPKTVQLIRGGKALELRIVVKAGAERDPQTRESFRQFGLEISRNVFNGDPVDVHLCDEHLKTLAVVHGR